MAKLPIYWIILTTVLLLIVIFLLNSHQFSNSLLPIPFITSITQCPLEKSTVLKSEERRVIVNASNENDFFIFSNESPLVRLYLDIVRDTICGLTLRTQEKAVAPGIAIRTGPLNVDVRIKGEDWPWIGISMIGQKRLVNIEWAIRNTIANNVQGDFIECGVWRGGGSVFARAVYKALDIKDRHVWVVDSFQGLPKARTSNDGDHWSRQEYLKVSLAEVQTNFQSFFLLDDQVHFCKGYFVDSLPKCNVSKIAVLRMDGDMYESTMDQLFNLYGKLSIGGVIIIDDYNIHVCVRAVHDFRQWHGITEEIKPIPGDRFGRYWIKRNTVTIQMEKYKPLLVATKKES